MWTANVTFVGHETAKYLQVRGRRHSTNISVFTLFFCHENVRLAVKLLAHKILILCAATASVVKHCLLFE